MGFRDRFEDLGKIVARQSAVGGRYEFEPRKDRMSRRIKGVQGPPEDRAGILRFVESREGVEAYVEPKTVMHPLSVVLVAGDGENHRFELFDDAYVRELTRTHGLKVFDAVRVGYPQRMRDHAKRTRAQD
jgi:preprotein translocase subunit Sec61beta